MINNFSTNEATVTMQCALTRQPNTLSASLSAYADTLGAFHRRHCRRALSYITTPKTMIYCLQTEVTKRRHSVNFQAMKILKYTFCRALSTS